MQHNRLRRCFCFCQYILHQPLSTYPPEKDHISISPTKTGKFGKTWSTQKVPSWGVGFCVFHLDLPLLEPGFFGFLRLPNPSFGQRTEFRCSRVRKTTVLLKPRGGNQLGVIHPTVGKFSMKNPRGIFVGLPRIFVEGDFHTRSDFPEEKFSVETLKFRLKHLNGPRWSFSRWRPQVEKIVQLEFSIFSCVHFCRFDTKLAVF